ncbi:MAG: hypothetical protein WCI51_09875 [Lentisphaerota bacterium]
MKRNLVFLAAAAIAFGAATVIAADKKADAAPAASAPVPASAPAPAAAPAAAADKAATVKKQTLCPKCHNKISKKYYLDSDGKRIYFCGSICAAKMKKELAGVVTKLEGEGITLDAVEKKAEKEKKK